MNFILDQFDKGMKEIQEKSLAAHDHRPDIGIDQRTENDRPVPIPASFVNFYDGSLCFFNGIDKRKGDLIELDVSEIKKTVRLFMWFLLGIC